MKKKLMMFGAVFIFFLNGLFVSAPTADAHVVSGRCPQYESLLREHNFPVAHFSRIMWRESRCKPTAVNPRSGATGLLQIMRAHVGKWKTCPGMTVEQLKTARGNIRCAARIYKLQGTRAWATTR